MNETHHGKRKVLKALEALVQDNPALYEALGVGPKSPEAQKAFNDCLEAISLPASLDMNAVSRAWLEEIDAVDDQWESFELNRRDKLKQILRQITDDVERKYVECAFRVIVRSINNMGRKA